MSQLAENIIKQWWLTTLPQVTQRDLNLLTWHSLPVKKIISLVGFRRVGKTYLFLDFAGKIGQQNTLYINFEDERIPKKVSFLTDLLDTLDEISGGKPYTLLMDEIQNIPGWSLWARRVVETTEHELFITGSSSKLSSAELPTELRGRSITLEVRPLNFAEFLRFKKLDFDSLPPTKQRSVVREYLTYGSFPEVALVDPGKKSLIIGEYYNTFVSRDLVERHKIRNTELLNALIKLLLNSPFYTISGLTQSLIDMGFDTGKATISRYLSYLHESFFVKTLELHTPSIKKRGKAAKKPYFIDNSFLFNLSTEFSQNFGRLMENTVFHNLVGVFYWQNYQGKEIDFVVRVKEQNMELIQVSYVESKSTINKREIDNLLLASNVLNCQKLTLITWDLDDTITKDSKTIQLVSLATFLLTKSTTRYE